METNATLQRIAKALKFHLTVCSSHGRTVYKLYAADAAGKRTGTNPLYVSQKAKHLASILLSEKARQGALSVDDQNALEALL